MLVIYLRRGGDTVNSSAMGSDPCVEQPGYLVYRDRVWLGVVWSEFWRSGVARCSEASHRFSRAGGCDGSGS